MSDVSQGPGWWMASDGKWYMPEQHPDYVPPPTLDDVWHGRRWWMATDGKWYPPEKHPDYVPPTDGATRPATVSDPPTMSVPIAGRVAAAFAPVGRNPAATVGASVVLPSALDDAMEKVRRLGGMLDAGRLSDYEFQQMRKEILGL